ncbi:uncharacterized protein [Dermacentor albipictus]|uniref:uncharacterized protein isoform X2 n=1 Tax=Dermacentor albipictus TaxID=60249 RepID=UPI0038FC5039
MDSFAIPFRTEGRWANLPGGSNGDDDPHGYHEAPQLLQTSEERLRLTVRTITGKVIHVTAFPSDTVLGLKRRIQDKEGLPPNMQRIFHRGELVDMYTLEECGLTDGCKLELAIRLRGGYTAPELPEEAPMMLRVWIRPREFVEVESHLGATIGSIKESIEKLTGWPAAHQTLQICSYDSLEDMSDEHTVSHYGLRGYGIDYETLYVSLCKGKGATE